MASQPAGDATEAGKSQKKPPLSCTQCRARKLKCDKTSPCHNCVRSGSECIFPARKRIQRPRKTKNAELLQRLNRLESIVGKVGLSGVDEAEAQSKDAPTSPAEAAAPKLHAAVGSTAKDPTGPDPTYDFKGASKPTTKDAAASKYMSGDFWSRLCDEVGGLKQALEHSTDTEDEGEPEAQGASPESAGGRSSVSMSSPGMVLGSPQSIGQQAVSHPSSNHIRYLVATYFRNVDMHLKILHRPTICNALYNLADYPDTVSDLSPEQESLFFAIYYSAVASLSPIECSLSLGRPRADLAANYQAGIERALARADYLNNTSLETLQALTLYACCLRNHNGSRASWAMLSLPIRLAQAIGIHRDGDGTNLGFSPYEAEQRRRLWWQLIVLDIRAAEDRGTTSIISRGSYNTRLPHNIDDEEYGPDKTAPLVNRCGPSDTTFSLCTAQSSGIFLFFEAEDESHSQNEEDTVRQAQHLESQFVTGADPNHVASYLASVLVRLIILKLWLGLRFPLRRVQGGPQRPSVLPPANAMDIITTDIPVSIKPPGHCPWSASIPPSQHEINTPAGRLATALSRQSTLRTAISIIELSDFASTGPYGDRFRWWSETYVQWHPLAVALAELCTQTEGAPVAHAWKVVESVFPRWSEKIADARRGSLWRPIRKLYKKAKAAREAALTSKNGNTAQTSTPQTWESPSQIPGLNTQINTMTLDPALTRPNMAIPPNMGMDTSSRTSDPMLQPRLIGDMILSDPTAHTLSSTPINLNSTQPIDPFPSHEPNMNSNPSETFPPLAFDDLSNAITQSLFSWADVNFDMSAMPQPPQPSTLHGNSAASQPHGTFGSPMFPQQTVADGSLSGGAMDWSPWDEFVLDTFAGSGSKSGESEGSGS
ncbi:hypothetical protein F5Y18DRAFT_378141 [Xylariaceae sp. FL1019]|nr:hypothetical protein F5Y18DRAFT_378141 [Xylariaceae sp. FL1019]